MSNYLAIATATATLRTILQNAVTPNIPGVSVNTTRPHAEVNDNPPTEITIYLFQVTPNAAFRNADLPTRRADGALMQRPVAALDLHYMFSFYGNEQQLEPQRMLGIVARTLHAHPYLTRDMIRETIQNNPGILGGSDLGEQIELIKFSPLHLSLEEFSKIWSVFYEIPYVLSVAYQASVVLIEEDAPTQSVLPVLIRNVYAVPFHQPVVDQVVAQTGNGQPALPGSPPIPITLDKTLLIQGHNLQGGAGTLIQIDEIVVQPTDVTDTQITLPLATTSGTRLQDGTVVSLVDGLRAGVQGLQVIHRLQMGVDQANDPLNWHRGVESNVAAFVLRPVISNPTVNAGTTLAVTLKPVVNRIQRVVLLLNEFSAAARQPGAPAARTYSIVAKTADQTWKNAAGQVVTDPTKAADTDSTDTITFVLTGVVAGTYLLRVQVDGAESELQIDTDPKSPTFNRFIQPQVTI
jgi:hypothetical protein